MFKCKICNATRDTHTIYEVEVHFDGGGEIEHGMACRFHVMDIMEPPPKCDDDSECCCDACCDEWWWQVRPYS